MRIPIIFSTDENYIFYTCVAITSLAQSAAPDTEYDIYLLTGSDFSAYNLLDEVEVRFANIRIQCLTVDVEIFRHVIIHNQHVTKAAFYRLVLSGLLQEDKCIYLDSDVIVTEDLQSLYLTEMTDYYIAGCRDTWIDLLSEEACEKRRQGTGIPSMQEYINSGVLLMNLEKIRRDGLAQVFLQHLDRNYLYEDQDILNVCCYGKILQLPAKWNIFTLFLGQMDILREKGISEDVLEAFRKKRGIIHYATPYIRPWMYSRYWANWIWWKTAGEWEENSCYREMYEKVHGQERRERWEYWLQRCGDHDKIVIFGFTIYGREICDWLLNAGLGRKLLFCDNAPEKWAYCYKGIAVVPLETANRENALFLNTSQSRCDEVQQSLRNHGIREEDILIYRKEKLDGYYRYLDSRYYAEELKDIFLREFGYGLGEFQEDLCVMRKLLSTDFRYRTWYQRYHLQEWILRKS